MSELILTQSIPRESDLETLGEMSHVLRNTIDFLHGMTSVCCAHKMQCISLSYIALNDRKLEWFLS